MTAISEPTKTEIMTDLLCLRFHLFSVYFSNYPKLIKCCSLKSRSVQCVFSFKAFCYKDPISTLYLREFHIIDILFDSQKDY